MGSSWPYFCTRYPLSLFILILSAAFHTKTYSSKVFRSLVIIIFSLYRITETKKGTLQTSPLASQSGLALHLYIIHAQFLSPSDTNMRFPFLPFLQILLTFSPKTTTHFTGIANCFRSRLTLAIIHINIHGSHIPYAVYTPLVRLSQVRLCSILLYLHTSD